MATILNPPAALKLKGAKDASKNWKLFKQSWHLYEIASGSVEKTDEVRVATFLHIAGPDALEKYNGFRFDSEEDKLNIKVVIDKFDADCKTTVNVLIERKKFFARKQANNETTDQYITELRMLCSSCDFPNPDETLRDQFVLNLKEDKARERLIEQAQENHRSLTFDKAIAIVKNYETSISHKEEIQKSNEEQVFKMANKKETGPTTCNRCGYKHAARQCPAYGKICSTCQKPNHFSKMCFQNKKKTHKIHTVQEQEITDVSEDTDNEEMFECI